MPRDTGRAPWLLASTSPHRKCMHCTGGLDGHDLGRGMLRLTLVVLHCVRGRALNVASPPPPGATGCSFWCTRGDGGSDISRCAHPECKLCPSCSAAQACEPTSARDVAHESCEPWCNTQHQKEHCPTCACRKCPFCKTAQLSESSGNVLSAEKACTPLAVDDGKVQACKSYCQERHASTHCKRCDCQSCSFCQRMATAAAATAAPKPTSMSVHQPPDTGKACVKTDANDLPYEACSKWCKAEHRGSHCHTCACKTCSFCGGDERPGVEQAATVVGGGACTAASRDDGHVESCKGYCSEKHASAHCARCDCKACGFCSIQRSCTPHDAADSAVEACEGFCLESRPQDHCPLCRCKRCGFCREGGGADGPVAASCTPHDANDVRVASCEPFCNAKRACRPHRASALIEASRGQILDGSFLLCACSASARSPRSPSPATALAWGSTRASGRGRPC